MSGQYLYVMSDDDPVGRGSVVDPSEVIERWFDLHAEAVFGYVARRLGPQIARDVSADVFRSAIEGFERFDQGRGSERSWLLGIATNHVRRHWRTEERRLRALERTAGFAGSVRSDPTELIDDRLDADRRLSRLLECVVALPEVDRELLVLVAWEGCSNVEVGEILGIPAGTIGSRLSRIRSQLRRAEGASNG